MSTIDLPTALAPVCNLTAIDEDQRVEHISIAKQIFARVQTVEELPDGYALRLPNDTETFLQAARFVENERKCCPFNFALELQADNGPFWLKLTGQPEVKQMLGAELRHQLDKAIIQAAGLN